MNVHECSWMFMMPMSPMRLFQVVLVTMNGCARKTWTAQTWSEANLAAASNCFHLFPLVSTSAIDSSSLPFTSSIFFPLVFNCKESDKFAAHCLGDTARSKGSRTFFWCCRKREPCFHSQPCMKRDGWTMQNRGLKSSGNAECMLPICLAASSLACKPSLTVWHDNVALVSTLTQQPATWANKL